MRKSQKSLKKRQAQAMAEYARAFRAMGSFDSLEEEARLLAEFAEEHVAPLSSNAELLHDMICVRNYFEKSAPRQSIVQRQQQALARYDKLGFFDKNIQELNLFLLNPWFLDGTEQNQTVLDFLHMLMNIQPGLCEKLVAFLQEKKQRPSPWQHRGQPT